MNLRNINGTSGRDCACGSWLKHWETFAGRSAPEYCPVDGCLEKRLVGAHVQNDSSTDKSWFIAPLCAKHNAKAGSLSVPDWVVLVSANLSLTCEKALQSGPSGLGGLYSLRR